MHSIDPRVLRGIAIALCCSVFLASAFGAARKFGDAYAGSEGCQTCHEDIYDAIVKSPHGVVETGMAAGAKGEWKGHACEACHGPGGAHAGSANATDIRVPTKMAAAEVDRTCLTCHLGQETHAGRLIASHSKQGISCIACHSVHANGGKSLVARSTMAINQQCASCHLSVWASFRKPYGHRLVENAMNCVDCHNPHGSFRRGMGQVFAANEPGCFGCHGDKRGPFTFEHAPVRFAGCGACHEPHGSANPRALVRHEVRLVCLECHANMPGPSASSRAMGVVPPAFHDLRDPRYRNCTVCHQKIHGSYTDGFLIR